jgi:Spy/CpxP family protein refolding chaperone
MELAQLESGGDTPGRETMPSRLATATGGLAVALLVGGSIAGAQPPAPDGPGGWGPDRPRRLARILDLTDAQKAQLKTLLEQYRPQMQALREQTRDNRARLREALASPQPDPTTVGEMVIEEHALREKGRALREEVEKAIQGFLTPEQKRKQAILEQARTLLGPGRRPPMGPDGPGRGLGDGPDKP